MLCAGGVNDTVYAKSIKTYRPLPFECFGLSKAQFQIYRSLVSSNSQVCDLLKHVSIPIFVQIRLTSRILLTLASLPPTVQGRMRRSQGRSSAHRNRRR